MYFLATAFSNLDLFVKLILEKSMSHTPRKKESNYSGSKVLFISFSYGDCFHVGGEFVPRRATNQWRLI